MTLIVSVDMSWDRDIEKALKSIKNGKALLIYDETLIKLSLEPALWRGWLGEKEEERVLKLIKERFQTMRNELRKKIEKLGIEVYEAEGNFMENLKKHIALWKPSSLLFLRKKGYNPYWNVVKHIIENADLELKYEVKP